MSPIRISDCPCPCRANATRSGSAKRSPIAALRPKMSYAAAGPPPAKVANPAGSCRNPRSGQSSSAWSTNRWDRPTQPPPRAISPRRISAIDSQKPHRVARAGSPSRRWGVGPFPGRLALQVATGQVGRGREQLEVVAAERFVPRCRGQQVARGRPRLTPEGVSSTVQVRAGPHPSKDRPGSRASQDHDFGAVGVGRSNRSHCWSAGAPRYTRVAGKYQAVAPPRRLIPGRDRASGRGGGCRPGPM